MKNVEAVVEPERAVVRILAIGVQAAGVTGLGGGGVTATGATAPAAHPLPEDWVFARLDPQTMTSLLVLKEKGTTAFGNGTSAVQVGKTVWFGTYGGDRIAYTEMP